ncbi:hypothetical protein [Neptunomonas sp.]|uniref:capsular polysaccharide export protein, LipB/KpsS family n=1 Tax=Neptunomonas sp. TaxID=1971898 RepID=UPI003564BA44
MKRVGAFSIGIASILHLDKVLDAELVYLPPAMRKRVKCDAIAGWGMKPSAAAARQFANNHDLPYIALEDGFLRSLGLGVHGHLEHSFIADSVGIYYDASRPSALEELILASSQLDAIALEQSSQAIQRLGQHRLSKYNAAPDYPVSRLQAGAAVLVVDQTYGDISVQLGQGSPETFVKMLETAVANHPDAEILVKVHPDVLAGKKKGYLLECAQQMNCTLIAEDVNPWAFFDVVSDVYVVTSHMGFEALVAGKKVHCFGMPYYAGWGLTQDYQTCERRSRPRSLEQVFYAVYVQYCRYLNPYTGQRCQLEDTIELLALQKRHLEKYRGRWVALKIRASERKMLKRVLGFGVTLEFRKRAKNLSGGSSPDIQLERGYILKDIASTDLKVNDVVLAASDNKTVLTVKPGSLQLKGLGSGLLYPLSIEIHERVAGQLSLDSIYIDPESGNIIDVETATQLRKQCLSYFAGVSMWSRCKRLTRYLYLIL